MAREKMRLMDEGEDLHRALRGRILSEVGKETLRKTLRARTPVRIAWSNYSPRTLGILQNYSCLVKIGGEL